MTLTIADAKKLTVPRLKEELTKRGLDNTGNKPELLAKLTESIEQAAEDLILSDAGGVADVHHLLSDDILNDDILDAPSIDGDLLGDTITSSVEEEDAKTSQEDAQKTEVVLTDKPVDIVSVEQGKRARAIRFGLPVTAESLSSDSAKAARAKRFDLPEDANRIGSDEAKAKRAERFGISTSNSSGTADKNGKEEKLAARAARFGLPVGGAPAAGSAKAAKDAKLAERAKRFGGTVEDAETEAKKKARLERFGTGSN